MRVTGSFGGDPRAVWLPDGVSEAYVSEPVVRIALRDGVAAAAVVELRHNVTPVLARALAVALPAKRPDQIALPRWEGSPIPDERSARDVVALVLWPHDRNDDWERLRRSRAIGGADRPEPAPLAMALVA
jgi:hypothetical protein